MRAIRRGDAGTAVVEIRAILVTLALLPTTRARTSTQSSTTPTERAVRAFQQSRGLTVDGEVERGDLAGHGRGPLAARVSARSPTSCPSHSSATTCGSCRSACSRWGTTSAAPDGIFGRADGPRGRPVPARGRAVTRRRVRPADQDALRRLGRKVVGGRPAAAARDRARSARPGRRWSASASSSTRAMAAPTPASSCRTARCAGPRRTSRSTSPPGWRAGSPPPGCGST